MIKHSRLLLSIVLFVLVSKAGLCTDFGEPLTQMKQGLYHTQEKSTKAINAIDNSSKVKYKNLEKALKTDSSQIKNQKTITLKQEEQRIIFGINNKITTIERKITQLKNSDIPKKEKNKKIKELQIEKQRLVERKNNTELYYSRKIKEL